MCLKCGGVKYLPGHQGKVKVQMLLGQEEVEGVMCGKEIYEAAEEEEIEFQAEEAIVSMHATSSNPQMNTMRFKGLIGNTPTSLCISIQWQYTQLCESSGVARAKLSSGKYKSNDCDGA